MSKPNEEDDLERQIADIASDYCDAVDIVGDDRDVEMKPYLEQLPDEAARAKFKELVNVHMLFSLAARVKKKDGQK